MPKNFNEKLIALLKTDARFVDEEGELVKAAVTDRAWKIDHGLVRLLLGDADIKAKFFDEIEGHWIFNINTFIEYVSDKNFLADSYTRFRNRIGLNIDDKFLRERGEVSLVWPYKDCVLEGGQTKQEEKRKEIFFNEILAQEEIDRLFDPKVLTQWKRYTVDGEEDVMGFKRDESGTIRENLIIKGNNLLALHTLKTQFLGKVKLIYIDPPYNTGKDGFKYNDNFNHSSWLTFMKNRLQIAFDLLMNGGLLFIQITDKEQPYLKILCDEIFNCSEEHYQQIIWKKRGSAPNDKKIGATHEFILSFCKNGTLERILNRRQRTEKQLSRYKNPDNHPKGVWAPDNLMANVKGGRYVKSLYFPIVNPETGKQHYPSSKGNWRFNKEKIETLLANKEIYFGKDGKGRPKLKRFLCDVKEGVPYGTIWDDIPLGNKGTSEIQSLFGSVNIFDTPKPEGLIKQIIEMSTNEGDLILDFFAGSGTTAAVAHKMHRQWITVEQMDYMETIPVERVKKVVGKKIRAGDKLLEEIEYDTGGISESVAWKGGGDFVYCELMQYNEVYMDKIQAAQSSKELVELWRDIAENSFLNWYVNPEIPEDAVNDFIAIGEGENGVNQQKKLLVELLDKNQLYVNLSEIDDEDFGISAEDKELNEEFYGQDPDEGLELRDEFVADLQQTIADVKAGGKTTPAEKVAEELGLNW